MRTSTLLCQLNLDDLKLFTFPTQYLSTPPSPPPLPPPRPPTLCHHRWNLAVPHPPPSPLQFTLAFPCAQNNRVPSLHLGNSHWSFQSQLRHLLLQESSRSYQLSDITYLSPVILWQSMHPPSLSASVINLFVNTLLIIHGNQIEGM